MTEHHTSADRDTLLAQLQQAHIGTNLEDDFWSDENSRDYWSYYGCFEEPALYPGRLPDELPFPVPLPSHSRLIDSARPLPRSEIEVLLETELMPEPFVDKYRLQLEALGWKPLRWLPPRYGFAPSAFPWLGGYLYRSDDRAGLSITVLRPTVGAGLVHLEAYELGRGTIFSSTESDAIKARVTPLLPAPPGSKFTRGERENEEYLTEGRVHTDMDLPGIHAYYAAQLEAKGRRRTDVRQEATRIESTWAFVVDGQDIECQLTVAATGVSEEYALRLTSSISASILMLTARMSPSARAEMIGWDSSLPALVSMLDDYNDGSPHAYLSAWARAEQVPFRKELTLEDQGIKPRQGFLYT